MRLCCCYLLALVSFPPPANSALGPVPLDLAIVVRMNKSDHVVSKVKDVLGRLPEVFWIGGGQTRVAVLANVWPLWMILTDPRELADTRSKYQKAVDKITTHGGNSSPFEYPYMGWPLKYIREKMLVDLKRPRAVIVINERWQILNGTFDEFKALRDSGVWLFVFAEAPDAVETKELWKIANELTVNSLADRFNKSDLQVFKLVIDRLLCTYNSSCFFTDRQQRGCAKDWWTPWVQISHGSCSDIATPPPPITQSCHRNECIETCDTLWPWQKPIPDCNQECGKIGYRDGVAGWRQLEFCPLSIECQKCSTTTSTTTTTTTSTTTTAMATTTTTTIAAATTTVDASTETSRSRGTEAAATEAATTNPTLATSSKTDPSKLQAWQIGLAVLLPVAIISVAAVIGVFLYRRKRRVRPKAVTPKHDQAATSTATAGKSAAVMTSLSVGPPVGSASSKSVSQGSAPTAKYAGTKSTPTSAKSGPGPSSKASPTRAK